MRYLFGRSSSFPLRPILYPHMGKIHMEGNFKCEPLGIIHLSPGLN